MPIQRKQRVIGYLLMESCSNAKKQQSLKAAAFWSALPRDQRAGCMKQEARLCLSGQSGCSFMCASNVVLGFILRVKRLSSNHRPEKAKRILMAGSNTILP